jgi:hypothetical protein
VFTTPGNSEKSTQNNVDLIIMGAHTRDEDIGAARYRSVVGSTMQKVAKSARCPVVIISRPCTTCWKLFSNIVVGTDFSKGNQCLPLGSPTGQRGQRHGCTSFMRWISAHPNREK